MLELLELKDTYDQVVYTVYKTIPEGSSKFVRTYEDLPFDHEECKDLFRVHRGALHDRILNKLDIPSSSGYYIQEIVVDESSTEYDYDQGDLYNF